MQVAFQRNFQVYILPRRAMHYHVFVNSFVAVHSLMLCPCFSRIRHFRNEKATGAEMCLAIVCWIVTGDAPVNYWPVFPLSRDIVPEVFAKV